MTTGEPKWFASERSELDAFLKARLAQRPTARQLRPCLACTPRVGAVERSAQAAITRTLPTPTPMPEAASGAPLGWSIPGRPATFATAAERPWKAAIAAAVPICVSQHQETSIRVAFSLGDDQLGANEPDLDNLLEPLLSEIINARRWLTVDGQA